MEEPKLLVLDIFIAGILTESEYARTVNTNTNTYDKTLQISYLIYRYSYSDEGSNFDVEDSDFVMAYGYITNFHEEEDER